MSSSEPEQGYPPAADPGVGASSVDRVRSWTRALADGLACANDAERVDLLRALEEVKCAAEAAQARTAVALDASVRDAEAAAGVRAERRGRGVAGQVGLARRCSPYRARQLIGLAKVVHSEMPHTAAAWRTGHISEWRAVILARETAALPLSVRERIDEELAADPDTLSRRSDRETAAEALRWAAHLDAENLTARRARAERDRHVSTRPAPDTMTRLTALLPLVDGVAVHAALAKAADSARAAGDERTRGQVMADTLVERVTGRAPASHDITINLVLTDTTLFGTSNEPARIPGYGLISADHARESVTRTLRHAHPDSGQPNAAPNAATETEEAKVFIRRLFTDPAGELIAMESAARTFPHGLAEFITVRDQTCRTPWCDTRIRHIDHITPYADGGPTSAINGQGLCEACNYIKTAYRWQARPTHHSHASRWSAETITPTGHSYTTHPPPWRPPPCQPRDRRRHHPKPPIDIIWNGGHHRDNQAA